MICCMGRLLDFGSLSRTWLITSWNTSNSGLTMKLMKPTTWHVAWLLNHWAEDRKKSFTDLRLRNFCCGPVTQRRNIQPHFLLPVPLVEELLHAPGRPLLVQVPGLGGVGHVRRVEHEAQHLGLIHHRGVSFVRAGHCNEAAMSELLPLLHGPTRMSTLDEDG